MKSEITLPGAELKVALSGLTKVAGRKGSLPVLQHLKLARQKNGTVTLSGTDLDVTAMYQLEQNQPGEPVELLLPLEQLSSAFKCNTSKEALTVVKDSDKLFLRYRLAGNPVELAVKTLPVEEWPAPVKITAERSPLPAGFGETLRQALGCCGQPHTSMGGACLDTSDQSSHYVVSCNGQMLFAANSFTFPLKESVTIPGSKFLNSSDWLDGEGGFLAVQETKKKHGGQRHILIENGRWQFVTRDLDHRFPEWKKYLMKVDAQWTRIELKPEAVTTLLDVLPKLPGAATEHHVITLDADKVLVVSGQNKEDAAPTKVEIKDVVITGKPKTIALNREYLLTALKYGLTELGVLAEESPMVCMNDGKRVVIMPVRTKEPPKQTTNPERKTEMPRQAANQNQTPPAAAPPSPATSASKPATEKPSLLAQIELLKENVKDVLFDLNGLMDTVKQMEKDKRANEREVESVRSTLKKLQQVQL
jgi:DNA polymerase III sliding clamp (beta) subunit (PCNA family)